jgi:hypothetical protein
MIVKTKKFVGSLVNAKPGVDAIKSFFFITGVQGK